ncbi:MAG: hypothetical protein ACQEQO_06980 [Thermodesulfobacteriota bacterium]
MGFLRMVKIARFFNGLKVYLRSGVFRPIERNEYPLSNNAFF